MISREQARALVEAEVCRGGDIAVLDEATIEKTWGWVFFYGAKDPRQRLVGNAPLMVERDTGNIMSAGTAMPIEAYIANYEHCHNPWGLYAPDVPACEFSKDELCGMLLEIGQWRSMSPFAADLDALASSGRAAAVAPLPCLPTPLALILAQPDVRIIYRYAAGSAAPVTFTACTSRAEVQRFVVVEPAEREGAQLVRAFDSVDRFLAWWLSRLSSPADRPVPNDLPGGLPLPTLAVALHAVDAYRRAKYQSALNYGATDALRVAQSAFASTLQEAVERRDMRWLLPAFLCLAPGVAPPPMELQLEQLAFLRDAQFLLPRHDPGSGQDLYFFGEAAQRMGDEFMAGVESALGIRLEVWTGQGALPLVDAFLAPSRLANHLILLEPDATGSGVASHTVMTRQELREAYAAMLSDALDPAAPQVALERAMRTGAVQANQDATKLASLASTQPQGRAPDTPEISSQIVCGRCGHANPATQKFCGECGAPLRPVPELDTEVRGIFPLRGSAPVEQSGRTSNEPAPAQVKEPAEERAQRDLDASAPAATLPRQTISVSRWYKMLSVLPRVHYRFRHDPADEQRLTVVEERGPQPRELPIDGEQVEQLALLLRRVRDEKVVSQEEFKALHAALRVRDADGAIWTVGLGSLRWNRLEQGRWIPADAPELVWLDMNMLEAVDRRMPPSTEVALIHAGGAVAPGFSASVEQQSCPACGKKLRAGAKFCSACGTRLATAPSVSSVSPESETISFEVPGRELKRLLGLVQYAMGRSDKPSLNGILVTVDAERLQLVATDGHRLAAAAYPVNVRPAESRKMFLGRDKVSELELLLGQSEAPVGIDLSPRRITFESSGGRSVRSVTSQLPQPGFPPFQSFLAGSRPSVARIARRPLLQALERVSGSESVRVRWTLEARQLTIQRVNQRTQEQLPITYRGDRMRIDFNARYLLDALIRLDSTDVELALGDALSSALVSVPGRDDFKYVVMPMRGDD